MTTDALTGVAVRLSSGPVIPALLASAAIPAVFPPVEIDDRYLIDGGIADNTPIRTALALGSQRIIVLPTGMPCAVESPPDGAVDMALHALNLLIHRQLIVELRVLGDTGNLIVVPPLCPMRISSYDFSHTRELIERARQSTRRWVERGGLEDRRIPDTLKPHTHRRREAE